MVGDHNRCAGRVDRLSPADERGNEVENLLKRNVFQDLFEQLPKSHKGMLTTQHRMDEHIGQLVSELFYEGRLQSSRQDGAPHARKRPCRRVHDG
ncbi:AAA domain-containing protein [Paraburkholderia sp. EG304]|uniref:AAA domain-containing protein n=1 Tax=unclassified Paraburkholderia TaxID=2615204 RepID=UPI00397AD2FC